MKTNKMREKYSNGDYCLGYFSVVCLFLLVCMTERNMADIESGLDKPRNSDKISHQKEIEKR